MKNELKDVFGNPLKGPSGINLELRVHTPEIRRERKYLLSDVYNSLKRAKDYALYHINKRLQTYFPKIV